MQNRQKYTFCIIIRYVDRKTTTTTTTIMVGEISFDDFVGNNTDALTALGWEVVETTTDDDYHDHIGYECRRDNDDTIYSYWEGTFVWLEGFDQVGVETHQTPNNWYDLLDSVASGDYERSNFPDDDSDEEYDDSDDDEPVPVPEPV